MKIFEYETRINVSAEEAFRWYTREGTFERLKPPWEKVSVLHRDSEMQDGELVHLAFRVGPLTKKWVLKHSEHCKGKHFKYSQVDGPFASWEHWHHFEKINDNECILRDSVKYELPFGFLGERLFDRFVKSKLKRMFKYRHNIAKRDMELHKKYNHTKRYKILVAGSSGFIGSSLLSFLKAGGHSVKTLSRTHKEGSFYWDPEQNILTKDDLEGFDAVINLAGENIASGRWDEEKKQLIKESRIKSTRLLSESLSKLRNPPKVFINASAIGFYGRERSDEVDESSEKGIGFLANVCEEWEDAALVAAQSNIRTVIARFGMVLSSKGGGLAKMLLPFKLGLGGAIGSGMQWISWIAIDDVLAAFQHILSREDIQGPVNFVSPKPVRNEEFAKKLGKVLHRPTIFPMPAFVARFLLGEMADELLLASVRVRPTVLEETGFAFHYQDLEEALKHLIGA